MKKLLLTLMLLPSLCFADQIIVRTDLRQGINAIVDYVTPSGQNEGFTVTVGAPSLIYINTRLDNGYMALEYYWVGTKKIYPPCEKMSANPHYLFIYQNQDGSVHCEMQDKFPG